MPPQPTNIQVIGSELAILWNDNTESYLPLHTLRKACPCASCAGEPDPLGRVQRPPTNHNDKSFTIQSWQIVGGYAFQPKWADGHNTGLYSWQYLHTITATPATSDESPS